MLQPVIDIPAAWRVGPELAYLTRPPIYYHQYWPMATFEPFRLGRPCPRNSHDLDRTDNLDELTRAIAHETLVVRPPFVSKR